jgi:hypothetical protein
MKFAPQSPPLSIDPDLGFYLASLEQRIAVAFEGKDILEQTNVAPEKPFQGMVKYADGTNWNPGSGEGVYGYYDGSWKKLG